MSQDRNGSSSRKQTVIVSGYAKAPEGTPLHAMYGFIGVVLEVDRTNHDIVDAEFVMMTEMTRRFLHDLVVGQSLADGVDGLVAVIARHYWAPSQRALQMSLRTAYNRYIERIASETPSS